eukprot:jgi/Antlo1/1832/431
MESPSLFLNLNSGFFGERLFDRDFIFLDSVINKSSIFNLGFFYVSSGVLSIIFALFASCCVSSKIRVYMRVFLLSARW